jgi:hypothetical protein
VCFNDPVSRVSLAIECIMMRAGDGPGTDETARCGVHDEYSCAVPPSIVTDVKGIDRPTPLPPERFDGGSGWRREQPQLTEPKGLESGGRYRSDSPDTAVVPCAILVLTKSRDADVWRTGWTALTLELAEALGQLHLVPPKHPLDVPSSALVRPKYSEGRQHHSAREQLSRAVSPPDQSEEYDR